MKSVERMIAVLLTLGQLTLGALSLAHAMGEHSPLAGATDRAALVATDASLATATSIHTARNCVLCGVAHLVAALRAPLDAASLATAIHDAAPLRAGDRAPGFPDAAPDFRTGPPRTEPA